MGDDEGDGDDDADDGDDDDDDGLFGQQLLNPFDITGESPIA